MKQLVLTPHGSVPIEDIKVGDEVIGKSEKGKYEKYVVTGVEGFSTGYRGTKRWVVVNGKYRFADHQSIYIDGQLRHAKNLRVGHRLENCYGDNVRVLSVETVVDRSPKIKLHIDAKRNWFDKLFGRKKNSAHTYFINGILVHNASRYWVGNGGSWAGTTHWSASSGGASGASEPTLSDDALFDANSFSSSGQTVTVNPAGNCAALNWTGVTNTPSLQLNEYLFTHGAITFVSGMTTTVGTGHYLHMLGTGSYNINFAGVQLRFPVTANDTGTYTLTGDLYAPTQTLLSQKGTLNLNGYNVTVDRLGCDGSTNVRTLSCGASMIIANTVNLDGSNLTFNANTSTIYVNDGGTFTGNSRTYNIVSQLISFASLGSSATISNLIVRAGSFVTSAGSLTLTTLTLYEDVTFNASGFSITNLVITKTASGYAGPTVLKENITVTGTFTANGLSQTDRLFIMGKKYYDQFRGTPVVITAAAVSMSNVDFQLITGAGAGTWSGTSIGNAGGNSGITFTNAVTRYWVGNGGNWEDTSHWSSSSGGSSGATMPLPQDTVYIDANSFSTSGQTITVNTYLLPAFDSSAVDSSPTFLLNNTNTWMVGATVRLGALTPSGAGHTLYACPYTGNDMTFYSGGVTLPWTIYSNGIGTGVFKLGDAMVLTAANGDFEVVSGYFDMNDQDLTTPYFFGNWDCFADIDLGAGTLYCNNDSGTNFDFESTSRPHQLHATEGRIVFLNTGMTSVDFEGGKFIFNEIIFEADADIILNDGFQVNDIMFLGDHPSVTWAAGKYFLIHDMKVAASLGNTLSFSSDTGGSPAYLICPEGKISLDYLVVQDIIAYSGPISNTGYKLPANTGSCDEGSTQNWANTANIVSSNNSYATVTMTNADNGNWSDEILAYGYDFSSIPDDAILLGMAVKIEGKVDIGGSRLAVWPYTEVNAGGGGCDFDEPSPMGPCELTTSDAEYEFGSEIHIWNNSYTVANVKGANFGAGIDMIQNDVYGSDVVVSIDALSIKVFYIANRSHQNWYMGANSTDVSGNEGLIFDTVMPIKKISGVSFANVDEVKPNLRSLVKKISGVGVPAASTLTETWAGGSIDTSKWNNWGGAQCAVSSQQLQISTILAGNYVGVDGNVAGKIHDLTGSYVSNQLVNAGNQALTSLEVYPLILSLHKETDWNITIMVAGNQVFARWDTDFDSYISGGFAYNAAVHKYFRIRESGGTIYYDWSTDGLSWTNFDSQAAPFDITSLIIGQMVGTWQAEASTTTAIFDNFNV